MGWHDQLRFGKGIGTSKPESDPSIEQPAASVRWAPAVPPLDPRQSTGGLGVQEDHLSFGRPSMPSADLQECPPSFEAEPVQFPSSPFVNLSGPHTLQPPVPPSTHIFSYGPWTEGTPAWQPPLPLTPPPLPPSPPPPPPPPPPPLQQREYDEHSNEVPRLEFPRTMSEIKFGLVGGPEDRDPEKAQFSELARALSAEGAVYILYPAPNTVNVLAFTSAVCSGGLEGLPDFVLNKYVDRPITFLRGLEYLQECISQREKGEQRALPALNPFSSLYPSGVIVVSDLEALTTVADPCSTLEELLGLLADGKRIDAAHEWVLKINSQTWKQMEAVRQHDAVVQGLWNVLHKDVFQNKIFQVMAKSEESSRPVADPPKAVRDAVKVAFQHRHDVRWVFFMHPDPATFKSEEDRRQCQKYVQSAQSQTTLVAETMVRVVDRIRHILSQYYQR
ncbi:unnamed protein product [Ostreobium quekettii]|uniref:Uncharacterized protein n=1 Tax=Ostreobium quekettii TaxID=121088 RepID=A0A8S1JBB3_9CHLO|nr:unnamed protein product [Ostreobium quekettii]